jgi:hypothetical protein
MSKELSLLEEEIKPLSSIPFLEKWNVTVSLQGISQKEGQGSGGARLSQKKIFFKNLMNLIHLRMQ